MMSAQTATYSYAWFIHQFEQAGESVRSLVSRTDADLLHRQPKASEWSAAQCFAHLTVYGNIYHSLMQPRIKANPRHIKGQTATFPPGLFWRGIMWLFEPPYRLKLKTIPSFAPQTQKSSADSYTADDFLDLQQKFIDQLNYCRQQRIALCEVKIKNPALPILRMTLSDCYGVIAAHQRRHLYQVRKTLQKLRC